jgi:Tfp pilus assembly protein PilO
MKDQNRQQFLIILTAIMAALLVGNSLIFNPLSNLWSKRSDEIKGLKEKVKDGNALIRRETAVVDQWKNMRANALPVNQSLAAQQVINALDNWSSASGAEVSSIMPQWKYDSTNYMTFNCHVQASGTLATLSQFVYQIEKGPMALKLDSMDLSAHDEFGQNLQLDLQISGLALLMPAATTTK